MSRRQQKRAPGRSPNSESTRAVPAAHSYLPAFKTRPPPGLAVPAVPARPLTLVLLTVLPGLALAVAPGFGAEDAVVAQVATGMWPAAVAVDPVAQRAFVTNFGAATMSIVDTVSNAVVGTKSFPFSAPRGALAVDPVRHRAYVGNHQHIYVYDTLTSMELARWSNRWNVQDLAVDPVSGDVFTADGTDRRFVRIDELTGTNLATWPIPGVALAVAVDPVRQKGYLASSADPQQMRVVNLATNAIEAIVPTGYVPHDVAVDLATGRAFVAQYFSNSLGVYDPVLGGIAQVPLPSPAMGVGANPVTHRVHVALGARNEVWSFDTVSFAQLGALSLPRNPTGVAVHPALGRAYVTLYDSGQLAVLDNA